MNWKVSDFAHFVNGPGDLDIFWNALTLGYVMAEQSALSSIMSGTDRCVPESTITRFETSGGAEVVQQLRKHHLLFPEVEKLDEQDYEKAQQGLAHPRIGILYLLLTSACNLACRYCFVENAISMPKNGVMMQPDVAAAGLDMFANAMSRGCTIEEPQIIFYGGEPFLNLRTMRFALKRIADMKRDVQLPEATSITINSNGTLVTEEVVEILKGVERLNVAFSVDGPESIHDQCRPYHKGTGSFQDIMRSYRLLKDHGIEAGLCCTISKYNVSQLGEIARWFADEMGVKSLGFNIMIENTRTAEVRGEREAYAREMSRQLINCFRLFRERGIHEDRFMRKVESFVSGKIYYYDCGGCGQQLVVTPDGAVGVCQGYFGTGENFVRPDASFDPLTHPLWQEWRARSPIAMEQCKSCIALGLCGGGCPYSADKRHGSIWELDDVFCVHAKDSVEFLLKDLAGKLAPQGS